MKLLFILIMLFYGVNAFTQNIANCFKPVKNRLYLVSRGTERKARLLAGNFNYADTNSTHIGIGFLSNSGFKVWHVTDELNGSASSLQEISLQHFLSQQGVFYYSIWEYQKGAVSSENLQSFCKKMLRDSIRFDYNFLLSQDKYMYCSEFCALVLQQTWALGNTFSPRCILIDNQFFSNYLNRKFLVYYPVDFFQKIPGFVKVHESKNPEIFLTSLNEAF